MEKNLRLQELFELAKKSQLVKTKGDFANLMGIKDQGTLSHALSGDERYSIDNLIDKAELALYRKGILTNVSYEQNNDVISSLREQIDFLMQNNTDLRNENDYLISANKELQRNLSNTLELLKIEQQKVSRKKIHTNSNIPISSEIEKSPTNKEYEEFIKFLKTNPDPLFLRGRIDIFLDEIGTNLEELSLSFGIEPKEAEQELEKNVSDISPEVLDMIKETYRERGSKVVHDTSITMDKLKRKYKAQALTIKHANEQI